MCFAAIMLQNVWKCFFIAIQLGTLKFYFFNLLVGLFLRALFAARHFRSYFFFLPRCSHTWVRAPASEHRDDYSVS
jgi:hypothetical protein